MARKISVIRQFLVDTLISKAAAIGIVINPIKWSKYDYKSLILDTIATGQGIEEQLWDANKSDVDSKVAIAAPETDIWLQNQILTKFQFNSTNPQLVEIIAPNFEVKYPKPNDSYKIIKYCSVKPGIFGTTTIKVAAQVSGLPADVDTTYGAGTLDTLRAFIFSITNSGILKVTTSGLADRLWIQLDVYYNGLYAAVIQTNVIAAINLFLANLSFNGTFLVSDLEIAIKNVQGVTDCVIVNLRARDNGTSFPGGNNMYVSNTLTNRLYNSVAGYIILEDSIGNTIIDPRPLQPSINNLNLIANS